MVGIIKLFRKTLCTDEQNIMKLPRDLLICVMLLLLFLNQSSALGAINEPDLIRATDSVNKRHYKTAYKHFMKMAQHGCPYSQCVVGIMHQKGIGTKKDVPRAMQWFEKAAAQDFADAEKRLGKLHLDGRDLTRDTELAAQWLEKAARHGEVEAQYELGKLDVTERSSKALSEGHAWLHEAASHGYAKAQELVEKLPPIPGPSGDASTASNGMAQGASNIQTSWAGYANVASSLDAAAAQ